MRLRARYTRLVRMVRGRAFNRHTEDQEAIGRRLAEDRGLTLIPSYGHPDVMAGQGTAAKELFEHTGGLDFLIVPLAGGGLLSGCAIAAR